MDILRIKYLLSPHIADIFFRIGYIEAWGRGFLLISEEFKKAGLPEPVIEEFAGGFQISFIKNVLPEKVTENQKRIIKLISFNPDITIKEISEKIGMAEKNVKVNLKKLKEKKLIARIGSDKGGHWKVLK
ncbi:MAG: winged helix-turn-helix transcriptional regulator [Fibrobacterota bacterium]